MLVRAGQTEASVDLAKLAGLYPAGVICEIMDEDGSMMRRDNLRKFAHKHGLRMITEKASGLTGFLLQLGPFGGAYVHGWGIRVWSLGYLIVVGAIALYAFSRRNL